MKYIRTAVFSLSLAALSLGAVQAAHVSIPTQTPTAKATTALDWPFCVPRVNCAI